MNVVPSLTSTNVVIKSTNGEQQETFVESMAGRVRERAKSMNFNASSFGAAVGLKPSTTANYWNGKRAYPTEALPRMASVLDTSVEYIVVGKQDSVAVADANDVEWESIPFFDLRELTDTGKGPPQSWTPFRRDWLNRTLGTSVELYLVRLLSDYRSRTGERDLYEGDLVFCREITPVELADGHICIFRRDQGLRVARYSLYERDRIGEDVITGDEIADDKFVPVARILGKFAQRL